MNIGEIRQSIENLAYIRGANNLRDASDAKVAFVERLLWQELVSVMTEAIKAAPEPEEKPAALKQQEPEEPPAETEPEQVPDTACPVEEPEADAALKQQEPEPTQGEVLANDRKECHKCQYYQKGSTGYCQYIILTGKSRGCSVAECEHWKDPKPKQKRKQAPTIKRKYQHVCKRCGARFIDYSTRTKYCPQCAKEFEDAENSDIGQE